MTFILWISFTYIIEHTNHLDEIIYIHTYIHDFYPVNIIYIYH